MEKKDFWISFTVLGLVADFSCPSGGRWLRPFPSPTPAGGSRIAAIGFERQLLAISYWL